MKSLAADTTPVLNEDTMRMARALLGNRWMKPFFCNARRWFKAAV